MSTTKRDPELAHLPPITDVGLTPYRLLESKRVPASPRWDFGIVHAAGAYVQQTTGWCNLATFANCVFYHQGEWVNGPLLGRKWHETSPWYLAALSQQPHDEGRFWDITLQNAGLITETDRTWVIGNESFLPRDGFRNRYIEVKYWHTNLGTVHNQDLTWEKLREYVINVLYGADGNAPAPVMLGAPHTRLIVGFVDGKLYLNDSAQSDKPDPQAQDGLDLRTWDELRQWLEERTNKNPDIGFMTGRFFAPPRPQELRHGCMVMREAVDRDEAGSIIFRRDAWLPKDFGRAVSYWHWDGRYPNGYYFDDLTVLDDLPPWTVSGSTVKKPLPEDSQFGHRWVSQDKDALHYRIWARNLTFQPQSFVLFVGLYRGETPEDPSADLIALNVKPVWTQGRALKALGYEDGLVEGALDIGGLPSDTYTIRFDLYQDSFLQDTKFITFCTTR